jgi:hypothetical protein
MKKKFQNVLNLYDGMTRIIPYKGLMCQKNSRTEIVLALDDDFDLGQEVKDKLSSISANENILYSILWSKIKSKNRDQNIFESLYRILNFTFK